MVSLLKDALTWTPQTFKETVMKVATDPRVRAPVDSQPCSREGVEE
eukprot:CAMPEP_0194060180 /NCGR_PEP_ID=MMETSP0009_2-20130614/71119_1 /TAXON_ID=210454 /ORGANISM="Grammatophora oceanica, Strain CCMP 410" /LENGTH=45 /DNA_ID= /DNA_START= /DNA_END= /DNA_ORIENTATION=